MLGTAAKTLDQIFIQILIFPRNPGNFSTFPEASSQPVFAARDNATFLMLV